MTDFKKTVTLHDVPKKAAELEEYVAALFQSSGHFVEKQVIEREPATDILELDAVATSYETELPKQILVEAKSGGWGFADIFKVRGWMTYLDIASGAFFASKEIDRKDPAFVHKKASVLGIRFVHLDEFSKARKRFEDAGFPATADQHVVDLWRMSYWAEREMIGHLRQHAKSNSAQKGPAAILEYLHLVNNGVFFTADIRQRLRNLYSAFQQHPKLALAVARELRGQPYDPSVSDPSDTMIRDALRSGAYPLIQSAFYAEHRARLAILKTAVDHECAVEMGKIAVPKIASGTFDYADLGYWILPSSFKAGLDELKSHKHFKRYPLFWQVFLWGFGGFYLKDRTDQEFARLAEQTGIPFAEIPNALRAFDILFPLGTGSPWLIAPGPTHMVTVKMMPFALQGIGAIHRLSWYGAEHYYALGYKDHTGNDLTRRHNALIDLLA